MVNELFAISKISSEDNIYTYSAEVNADSPILKGHFENMPVVPGVCTMEMIKCCIADALNVTDLSYKYVAECKFIVAILPQTDAQLLVKFELKEDNKILADVTNAAGDKKMLKLKATIAY